MKKSLLALSILLSASAIADYKIIISGNNGTIKLPEITESQTDFVSHTFTSCGKEGRIGPSLSQCQSAYSGTEFLSGDYGFTVNQGIQSFVVPASGDYKITAYGPRGVNNNNNVGKGAIMEGVFSLQSGQKIQILVGQFSVYNGVQDWQGGSGGTFVALGESNSSASPLVVAGGGGTNRSNGIFSSIMNASTGTSGKDGSGGGGGDNGSASEGGGHNGANRTTLGGAAAAGFYGSGLPSADVRYHSGFVGAQSFINGGTGGTFKGADNYSMDGGFGGASSGGWGGSGGGGGYSGGGNCDNQYYSGGGGSFISADATSAGTSDGSFQITGNEPTAAYTGPVQNIGSFNSTIGRVVIQKL